MLVILTARSKVSLSPLLEGEIQLQWHENISKAYLEPYQTRGIDFFAKIVNAHNPLIIFAKKFDRRCLIDPK